MMRPDYKLDNTVLKSVEAFTLHQSDKASIEISKDALALPIKRDDRDEGYIFLGPGKLIVDAIVETEEGAFGKPIQRALKEPFLMLGDTKETSPHFSSASEDDRRRIVADEEAFRDKAQELLNLFLRRARVNEFGHTNNRKGWIFAFPNGENELDTLVSEGSKLVYKTREMSFISNGDKSILHGSGQVILSDSGRSLVIDKPHQPHSCC
jgi:hypothetical protein